MKLKRLKKLKIVKILVSSSLILGLTGCSYSILPKPEIKYKTKIKYETKYINNPISHNIKSDSIINFKTKKLLQIKMYIDV
jgi:hypothetical protein